METLKRKLSSRKLWAAIAGVITGLAMVFGLDEGIITSVSGAVVSVASIVVYIITEGRVDAAAVKTAVEDVQSAADAVTGGKIQSGTLDIPYEGIIFDDLKTGNELPVDGEILPPTITHDGPSEVAHYE